MTRYRIVVDGELSDRFVATFGEMHLERGLGTTSLIGEIADQAQLLGLLARVADLGLSLVSFGPDIAGPEAADDGTDAKDGRPGP